MKNLSRRGKVYADNCNSYPYRQHNGGRSDSGKKYNGDCCAIALAICTGVSYDTATAALVEDGGLLRKSGGTYFEQFIHAMEWDGRTFHGFRFDRMTFPAEKGKRRMHPAQFAALYPKGAYIVMVSRHAIACVDGVFLGEYPVQADRCIYSAYKIKGEK